MCSSDLIAHGLLAGSALTLMHTAISQVGYQFDLKKGAVLALPETGLVGRLKALVGRDDFGFTLLWLTALGLLVLSRTVQLAGAVAGIANSATRVPMLFLGATSLYFLVINGPIGYAKYRLPMEPFLIIATVAGAHWLTAWWQRHRGERG